ncbi:type II toxin-antitoxin system RelE/ParE family toxin [Streptomyces sp. NPDC038707]|uniref:type II toxin-antitoxin system RelE/ParE family toxin n=1 Tax=Streptomyces sp. NPDC038707 TaxID=3154329 RepID=UPI00340FC176
MTWEVPWEPAALDGATGFLDDDPEGVDTLLQATGRLTEDPGPGGSRAWGAHRRRLHRGPWRVLYRVDEESRTLHAEHVGRARA